MDNLKAFLGPLRKGSLGSHRHQSINTDKDHPQDPRTNTFGISATSRTQVDNGVRTRTANTSGDNKRQRVDGDAYFYIMWRS